MRFASLFLFLFFFFSIFVLKPPLTLYFLQEFSLKGKKLEIIAELGKGSQASVWKASIDGYHVALKQIDLTGAKGKYLYL